MRTFRVLAIAILGFTSCSDEDDSVQLLNVEAELVSNLDATATRDFSTGQPIISGDFTKFDFSTGTTTTSETDWDIAFRGTVILVNGGVSTGIAEEPTRTGNAGAYIVDSTFENVNSVTETSFVQDSSTGLAISTSAGDGWYNYDQSTNTINPIGNTILIRTADNRYAKVQILSFYEDAPATITPQIAQNDLDFYTFNYVYQPNEGVTMF